MDLRQRTLGAFHGAELSYPYGMPTLRFSRTVPTGLDPIDYARVGDQIVLQLSRAMRWDGDRPPEVNIKFEPLAEGDPNVRVTGWVPWDQDLELINPLAEGDDPELQLRPWTPPKMETETSI